ncbi:MAG: hypothetical protein V3571_13445 [Pseudodesulfovibrio sp.]
MVRNTRVEEAVQLVLGDLDNAIAENPLNYPSTEARRKCDDALSHRSGSVRLASIFLTAYSVIDTGWDFKSIPIGIRGQYGDKLLSENFNRRNVTIHKSITAFGENLGWKGNVTRFDLSTDERFSSLVAYLANASAETRRKMVSYFAATSAISVFVPQALPAVSPDVLTFARAKNLFNMLLKLRTEGHVQQFLIAALLKIHRDRHGLEVRTHHPHASDTFDETAGDIEEFHAGELNAAYEVTVRPDWKNRISDFRAKMDNYGLTKYVIIASDVNSDDKLSSPEELLRFVEPIGRDIAIVDIIDFVAVFLAELSAKEIRDSVNACYTMLMNCDLCGRSDFIQAYRGVVDAWLDTAI